MGREIHVDDATSAALESALASAVAQGVPCQIVMIDGALCLPTAHAPDTFRELRLRTPAGMITARRDATGMSLLVFGNADAPLIHAQAILAEAMRRG